MLTLSSVLQNRYRISRLIASGRTGAVYEAQDERLGKTVAVKETFISNNQLREQFEREATLLANLDHRALPKVTDHFAEGSGLYLVMDYIGGDDLKTLLERQSGLFQFNQVMAWAYELLDALEYLHTHEPPLIHGDIKPANLKLTPQGQLMLLDFGLSKGRAPVAARGGIHDWQYHPFVRQALKLASLVLPGLPIPSIDSSDSNGDLPLHLRYAPPEQMRCEGTDARSDLFSLAATLYHLMIGQAPVDALTRATDIAARRSRLRQTDVSHLRLPLTVAVVLKQAMSLNRDQRHRSAAALRQALQAAVKRDVTFREQMIFAVTGRRVKKSAAEPRQALTAAGPAPLVQSLDEFETVRLDAQGQIAERQRRQAQCFNENLGGGMTLEMVCIPGGTFLMGSPASEAKRRDDEGSQHPL